MERKWCKFKSGKNPCVAELILSNLSAFCFSGLEHWRWEMVFVWTMLNVKVVVGICYGDGEWLIIGMVFSWVLLMNINEWWMWMKMREEEEENQ